MAKYTFLLPAYKAAYFEVALRNIQNQTYKDFLCIVSDDCSPEDLKLIFNRVCFDDTRFVYRRNKTNMGGKNLVSHWNLLVDMCETDYFMMAGDDDIYLPDFLLEVEKLQVKYPTAGVIRSRSQYINQGGNITDQDSIFPEYQDALTFLFNRFNSSYISGILNYAFRKDVIVKEKQFADYPVAWFADEAAVIACSKYGICTTYNILTSMRISGINLSCQRNPVTSKQKIEATKMFYKWSCNFLEENCTPHNKLEENRLESVDKSIRKYTLLALISYIDCLGFFEKIRLYRQLKSKGYLGSTAQSLKYLILILKGN